MECPKNTRTPLYYDVFVDQMSSILGDSNCPADPKKVKVRTVLLVYCSKTPRLGKNPTTSFIDPEYERRNGEKGSLSEVILLSK